MKAADTSIALLDSAELTDYCRDLFAAVGMPADDAQLTAEQLVSADLRGVESHGVVRVPIYVERLRRGVVEPRPHFRVVRETPGTAVFDGGNAMGQVAGQRAMLVRPPLVVETQELSNEVVSMFRSEDDKMVERLDTQRISPMVPIRSSMEPTLATWFQSTAPP